MPGLISGGHAIMLAVEIPADVRFAVEEFVAENPAVRSSKVSEAHLTLVFVGRNLPRSIGQQMLSVASLAVLRAPQVVHTTGQLEMFGRALDHVVTLVDPAGLVAIREYVVFALGSRGIAVDTGFGFRPHITLATSESDLGQLTNPVLQPVGRKMSLKVTGLTTKVGSDRIRESI